MSLTEAHDPTASATTFPEHPALLTRLSRNEVETLCLKAARGAGMPWGLAEEAGFAAGWLAARSIDGPAALLAHLAARPAGGGALTISGRIWAAQDGRALCPITAGASLDDHAGLPEGVSAAPVMVGALRHPVLAVPHLARIAKAINAAIEIGWNGEKAIISADGEVDPATLTALSKLQEAQVVLVTCRAEHKIAPPAPDMCPLSAETLAGLNALSMRTTVPASETSRRGAGAMVSDND